MKNLYININYNYKKYISINKTFSKINKLHKYSFNDL